MDEKPLYRRFVFSPIFWGIVLVLSLLYVMSSFLFGEFDKALSLTYFQNLFILFLIFLLFWFFFFAQFILPVRTNKNRFKIFERLLVHFFLRKRGPALFIKDGSLVESKDESKKKGAGVIVLDSASAAVLKKYDQYTRAVGPGVVFTQKGESIAAEPVPLFTLVDNAGPREKENPFAPEDNAKSHEAYKATQERRLATSALTRDGIEIVPNINIVFKIDAKAAQGKETGSRFGYNQESVHKAIWHTSVTPTLANGERINWNRLPINIAVDLWREYLGKYRFEELFQASQDKVPNIAKQAEKKVVPDTVSTQPIYEYGIRGILCDFITKLNNILDKLHKKIQDRISPPIQEEEQSINAPMPINKNQEKTKVPKETALQSIKGLINQRLKEENYPLVDRYGKVSTSQVEKSLEYQFLQERGIRILSVSISNLRFSKRLEEGLVEKWSTTWLKNAKEEEKHINGQYKLSETRGQERALLEYADDLSKEIIRKDPKTYYQAVKTLIRATRKKIIRDQKLHQSAEKEISELTDLLQWIEKGDARE